jgi:transcriptional regulator with XRE-family HTH domain
MITRTYRSNKERTRRPTTVSIDGARLRELRLSMGLSQEQVGTAVGRTKMWVSQVEMEKTMPSIDATMALQEFFGVAAADYGAIAVEVGE